MGGFSFRYKRSLFLGAPGLLPQQEGEDQNTYRAEDESVGALGLRKTPEPPLDLVFAALPFLAYGLTGLIGNLVQGKVWLALLFGVPLTLAGIGFLVAIRSRKWGASASTRWQRFSFRLAPAPQRPARRDCCVPCKATVAN